MLTRVSELPPPRPGYVRAFRGEYPHDPKSGAVHSVEGPNGEYLDWWLLPTPPRDGIERVTNGRYRDIPGHMNCATRDDTLHVWWPEWAREVLRKQGMRFVALDVPDEHAIVLRHQIIINRDAAEVVAEIH